MLCRSKHNHPDQVVIDDQFDKGRIPLGLFQRTFKAHSDWEKHWYPGKVVTQAALALEHRHMPMAVDAVRVLQAAGGMSVCAGLSAVCDKFGLTTGQDDLDGELPEEANKSRARTLARYHDDSEEVPGLIDEDSDSDKEEDVFGEVPPGWFRPEEDRIHDGLYDPPVVSQHQPSVLMQPTLDIVLVVPEWARGYPGLSATGTWDLASMRPGSLWFADEIHFDLCNIWGQKQSMLFMFDVVTGGMRVAFDSSK